MVDIAPFRALRCVRKSKSDISDFICPPYDVISPAMKEDLLTKSEDNIVRLELPDGDDDSKYTNAADILQRWKSRELLQQDRRPSFYLLETTYKIEDPFAPKSKLKRYGVFVALRLEVPGKGSIHPHEKTLPKAKEDRLKLVTATQTNISSIFGLFFDRKKEWKKWITRALKERPMCRGTEKKNLQHRMWKLHDQQMLQEFRSMMKDKDLYIADGHHRYEVSWAYKDLRLKENPAADLHEGWQHVMAYICPMEESGLLMLPTHRLVKSEKTYDQWKQHLELVFDIRPMKKASDLIAALSKRHGTQRILGWINSKGSFLLTLKKDISVDRCLSHRPDSLRKLEVVLLHDIAMGEAPGVDFLKEKEVEYLRDIDEIVRRTKANPAWVGFLLSSPGVDSLADVASSGEVMPPKTTYFYPKVPTGFTLMPLDQRIE